MSHDNMWNLDFLIFFLEMNYKNASKINFNEAQIKNKLVSDCGAGWAQMLRVNIFPKQIYCGSRNEHASLFSKNI